MASEDDLQKLKRREGSTRHQRKWRQKIVAEIAHLREQALSLEAEVQRRKTTTKARPPMDPLTLPWQDVAESLRDESATSVHRNRALKLKHAQYATLVSAMARWVQTSSQPLVTAPRTRPTWRHTALLAEPMGRQLGVDWITTMLFHNTERMLDAYGVYGTATSTHMIDYSVNVTEADTFEYVWMTTKHVDMALEHARDLIRMWLYQYATGAMWRKTSSTLLDVELLLPLPRTTYCETHKLEPDEMVRFLSREFRGEHQSIFVGQNIHADECMPMPTTFRNRAFWYVLDRAGPTSTKVQMLHVTSHLLSPAAEPLGLVQEGALMGCDLSMVHEVDQLEKLTRHANRVAVKEVEGLAASFGNGAKMFGYTGAFR
ncbi:hypothetical protein SDRG_03924 [Saprolegnia diclina VS20]|uniref:Uncharacterized protein n=1 Tax=Saprolegnia diclina (strain VS20) TaxID=1156394 RepID=T0QY72_SAPDV|nr:hypothetical protein SDRG_03924 [Saprolegnia diclina VS20]EQC38970.1 hypothetical protein SDRG_03924 [Saprolegnia diclina VS20]|eukprot:XP_008607794.1 hypothetical protein SDRG_03924 [Saprolegnia diclina VS20]